MNTSIVVIYVGLATEGFRPTIVNTIHPKDQRTLAVIISTNVACFSRLVTI